MQAREQARMAASRAEAALVDVKRSEEAATAATAQMEGLQKGLAESRAQVPEPCTVACMQVCGCVMLQGIYTVHRINNAQHHAHAQVEEAHEKLVKEKTKKRKMEDEKAVGGSGDSGFVSGAERWERGRHCSIGRGPGRD